MTNLTTVGGVGTNTAEKLEEAGYDSLEKIKKEGATEEELKEAGAPSNAASNLVREARQRAITIQSGDEVYEEFENKERVPTGIDKLDKVLNGGWESGYVVAIGGESGSGKTQLTFQSLGQAVKSTGKPAAYIETERGRYRGERIREMFNADIQSKVYKVSAYGLDQQKVAYETVKEEFDDLSLVAIDSFTSRFRLGGEFSGRENFTDRSEEMAEQLSIIENLAAGLDIPVIATCQAYQAPTQYSNEPIIWGGSVMAHTVNFIVKTMESSGAMVKMMLRNHPSCQDQTFDVQINEDGLTTDPA